METLSLYNYCHSVLFREKSLSIVENTAVITEFKKSPLYDFAVEKKCPLLSIPFDVGGRFSIFTSVGFFPLAFMGVSLKDMAKAYRKALAEKQQVVEVAGQLWASHLREEVNLYSFQYCDALRDWSFWLQQLWSESLSKAKDQTGSPAPSMAPLLPVVGFLTSIQFSNRLLKVLKKSLSCFIRFRHRKSVLSRSPEGLLKIL